MFCSFITYFKILLSLS